MIKCCHGCVPPKRCPGCHGVCPEYLEEKRIHEEEREARRIYQEQQNIAYLEINAAMNRALRRRGKRR